MGDVAVFMDLPIDFTWNVILRGVTLVEIMEIVSAVRLLTEAQYLIC